MEMYWGRQLLVFVAWSAHYNGKWGGVCWGAGGVMETVAWRAAVLASEWCNYRPNLRH